MHMRACVHACVQERVYRSRSRNNGERERGGTITVPRFRATTRCHPFDLHPPMPCSKPTSDIPHRLCISLSFFNARSHPRCPPRTLFYIPFCFLPSTCRNANPHSCRERRSDTERIDYFIASRKGSRWIKALFARKQEISAYVDYDTVLIYATAA